MSILNELNKRIVKESSKYLREDVEWQEATDIPTWAKTAMGELERKLDTFIYDYHVFSDKNSVKIYVDDWRAGDFTLFKNKDIADKYKKNMSKDQWIEKSIQLKSGAIACDIAISE